MSVPVEAALSAKQRELFGELLAQVQRAQTHYLLFCETMFRGVGAVGVENVQLVDGKLMGEIRDEPRADQ